MSWPLSRRRMLGLTVGLPVAVALAPEAARQPLALADARLLAGREALIAELFGGRMPEPLGTEPVRLWRDGLGQRVAAAGGAVALVRYDQALLLRGLAREEGLRIRSRPLGKGAFHLVIERRG